MGRTKNIILFYFMSDQSVFKIYFGDKTSRFHLASDISFFDFVSVLREKIFATDERYHCELYLQYEDSENERVTVSSAKEWNEALRELETQNIKKFFITEGSGVYFKNSPPPHCLYFYVKQSQISGNYAMNIMFQGEDQWSSFSDFIIFPDGSVRLGNDDIVNPTISDDFTVEWTNESNHSAACLKISFDQPRPILTGSYNPSSDEIATLKGEWQRPVEQSQDPEQLKNLSERVPQFLSKFFPGGKILPHLIQGSWLEPAIKVIRVLDESGLPTADVDLDLDLKALFDAVHQRAVDNIPKDLALARELLNFALELNPKSPYAYYNLACISALESQVESGLEYLRKAIDFGYDNWNHLATDEDLISLHNDSRFFDLFSLQ